MRLRVDGHSAESVVGSFKTLAPPPGELLCRFATVSDTHVGEGCAGTAFNEPLLGSSVPPCFSAPDYAARMDAGMVSEIARREPLLCCRIVS